VVKDRLVTIQSQLDIQKSSHIQLLVMQASSSGEILLSNGHKQQKKWGSTHSWQFIIPRSMKTN
jgi:hypothetical protein